MGWGKLVSVHPVASVSALPPAGGSGGLNYPPGFWETNHYPPGLPPWHFPSRVVICSQGGNLPSRWVITPLDLRRSNHYPLDYPPGSEAQKKHWLSPVAGLSNYGCKLRMEGTVHSLINACILHYTNVNSLSKLRNHAVSAKINSCWIFVPTGLTADDASAIRK